MEIYLILLVQNITLDKMDKIGWDGVKAELVEAGFSADSVAKYVDMFGEMEEAIQEDTVRALMHVKVEQKVEREEVAKATGTNKDDTAVNAPKRRTSKKINISNNRLDGWKLN